MKLPVRIFDIEEQYYEECAHKGKVERIDYHTRSYLGEEMDKYAFVYVPYGYDTKKKYEILYLIHGGGESAEKYLYQDGENNVLKRIVDNMIERKQMRKCLICTPSFYPYNKNTERDGALEFTKAFAREMRKDLIPAVEGRFHACAQSTEIKDLVLSRNRRYAAGWSCGSAATWFLFLEDLAYFSAFGAMSADCWSQGVFGSRSNPKETAKDLCNAVYAQGYKPGDYHIFSITGDKDEFNWDTMPPLAEALKAYPEEFDREHFRFYYWKDGEHHTPWRLAYTYNILSTFLKGEAE